MRLFSGQHWHNGWWVRVGSTGPGLQCLHRRDEPVFTERNGYRVFWPKWPGPAWFPWRFGLLGRIKAQRVTVTFPNGNEWSGEVYADEETRGPRFRVEDECP